ncbi:MAG: tetratricopeptide repeat protein [Candidatus Eremiobacteraeota bacterium]|nr:tetratricopeptide repeat protein [Candidatus Eremiobacteraeota bacterium]
MRLEELELRLVLDPSLELRYERAAVLGALERTAEAKTELTAILAEAPEHARAHARLAQLLRDEGELEGSVEHFRRALELDPSSALPGRTLRSRPIAIAPARCADPFRLLIVGVEGEGNVPLSSFLTPEIFEVATLIVDRYDGEPLPPHERVFNLIGDADRCAAALVAAEAVLRKTAAPVVNRPRAVLQTGRVDNARRLGALADVVTPRYATFPRRALEGDAAGVLGAAGFAWPILLRVPGFHTGEHFVKVESAEQLAFALAELPGAAVLAIEYLDARDGEGRFRKYRAIAVDRVLYPLHLAISKDWKVHYFSADMAENAPNREADAAFLDDMHATLGPRALAALERIVRTLDLEFAGIDFALDSAGRILLFEANATMIVPEPPEDARWDYRREPVRRIVDAVRAMLAGRPA